MFFALSSFSVVYSPEQKHTAVPTTYKKVWIAVNHHVTLARVNIYRVCTITENFVGSNVLTKRTRPLEKTFSDFVQLKVFFPM